ncbi:unnamed protein product [Effrenium voratum]|nr:unnamed protein product [Effrenium voratum]
MSDSPRVFGDVREMRSTGGWAIENPKTSLAAAAAVITGGLFTYWRPWDQNSMRLPRAFILGLLVVNAIRQRQLLRSGTVDAATPRRYRHRRPEPKVAEAAEKPSRQNQKAGDMHRHEWQFSGELAEALRGSVDALDFQQLLAARMALLGAALEGECNLTQSKPGLPDEVLGKEELIKYVRAPAALGQSGSVGASCKNGNATAVQLAWGGPAEALLPQLQLLGVVNDASSKIVLHITVLWLLRKGGAKNIDLNDQETLKKITVQATGVCSWRAEGIKHRKNEVFIDVIENVNILMSTKRERLRADVSGEILVNCKLSGMPECKFGMNDKLIMTAEARARSSDKGIALDDYRFHQCVRLSKFDVDREITFIPPDEPFQLMTYRITENIESPFKLLPNVKVLGRSRLELSLQVTAMYDRNIEATNVRIDFPCPKNTAKAHIPNTAHGKARYDPAQGAVVWRIRRFPGRHEYNLLAEAAFFGVRWSQYRGPQVELASTITEKQWVPPIPISPPSLAVGSPDFVWLSAMVNYDKNIQGAKRDAARQAHEAKLKAKQDKEDARRAAAKAKREEKNRELLESIAEQIDTSEEHAYGDVYDQLCEDGAPSVTDPQVLQFLADHTDIDVQKGAERLTDALRQVLAPGQEELPLPQFLDFLRENAVYDSTAVSKFLETCHGDTLPKTEATAVALHVAQRMALAPGMGV